MKAGDKVVCINDSGISPEWTRYFPGRPEKGRVYVVSMAEACPCGLGVQLIAR